MSEQLLLEGRRSLDEGDWSAARAAFEGAIVDEDRPEAHDGLARALWWLRDVDGAIAELERAYALYRRSGRDREAVAIALRLAREYSESIGNEPVASGWLARAEGILERLPLGPEQGWFAVSRGRLQLDPTLAIGDAQQGVELGRDERDPELEATALALLGLARIAAGEVEAGMQHLDEAMVVVTAGEVRDDAVFGDVCCLVTRAAEESGDISRLERWNEVVMSYMQRSGHAPLLEFCGTCCAEVLAANGQLVEAEGWLERTLTELEGSGQRARCVHPAAKLAELRLLQGRPEDAARLLHGFEDRPDALRASAAVHLANGEEAIGIALLLRRLSQVGESLLAVPVLAMLVDGHLARGELAAAGDAAERMRAIAERSTLPRARARADLASGRVAIAGGDLGGARGSLEAAVSMFDRLQMPIDAAVARTAMAEAVEEAEPEIAVHEARVAFDVFDEAGATALADHAAGLIRRLGGPARTGPKAVGTLSKRETEVLYLLGEGLSNAEIAARLYISTKTAGHHVSSVLAKLGLRNRAEAGAFAVRHSAALRER